MSTKKSDTKEKQINTVVEEPQPAKERAEKKTPKKVDPHMAVPVRNGFHGKLIYTSRRTGERFVWETYGDEQYIELSELRNAKGASRSFFENNWFMFEDDWIPDYLGVAQYYKNAIPIDSFDDVFQKTPSEIEALVSGMNASQKRSMAYRAKVLIGDGVIDSNRMISMLEKILGIDLTE